MRGKVVVLTGASSGLGRAAAVAFARAGARVVVAARRRDALEETAALCRAAGGEALVVPTDVTDEQAVHALAAAAVARFGRIDVWVNNAGVTAFGALDDGPFEPHRRVIETNLFGAMFGARAALPIFKRQHAGVLINVGSILSKIGQPFVPSYVISKFALRGLTETLRTALADEPDIHACTLLPYAIDTPHFQEGANRTGFDAHAMAPMQTPEKVARAMVALARRPRRERHVPRIAGPLLVFHTLFPAPVEWLVLHLVREWHFGFRRLPRTQGNLFAPTTDEAHVHGERPARIGLAGLVAWAAGHVIRLLTRPRHDAVRAGPPAARLQPHAEP